MAFSTFQASSVEVRSICQLDQFVSSFKRPLSSFSQKTVVAVSLPISCFLERFLLEETNSKQHMVPEGASPSQKGSGTRLSQDSEKSCSCCMTIDLYSSSSINSNYQV
ncbi:hypothetical protein FGO68_gene16635 [Halteria grandinella]|uniref:Uncharacterized protein n=1 Tax=Halteria grandinella TaxID=5974 RepID=A0A8J8SXB6_HALGN|nr:hypothetical protein FGO68_gene16635 [Halteria grandinella]